MLLTKTTNYAWFDKLQRPHIKKEKPATSFPIPSYNPALMKRVRTKSELRAKTVKEYCKKAMPNNYYLRVANEQYKGANGVFTERSRTVKKMYFDFKYKFLYCPTPKVTHYLMQNISRETC